MISDQNIGSQTNRDRPLGVSAQCNTRHFQISGLFLNSTGIGDNHHGPPLKSQEFNIGRSEEHTSELQSLTNLVCRLLLEKKKKTKRRNKTNVHQTKLYI